MASIGARCCELIPSRRDIDRSRVACQINLTPPPFRRCPKDFETMNEERDDDEDDEEGEAGGGGAGGGGAVGEDRAQAEGIELSGSKESRTQKTSEKTRVFTIPKPPVLRRSPIEGASRTDGR